MKTNLPAFLACAALLLLLAMPKSVNAQAASKVLTVRTLEVVDDSYQGKIVIIEENGKMTEIKLARFKPGVFVDNSKKIHEALNSVVERGYKIIGTSGGAGAVFLVTNYIFQKVEPGK